MFDNLIKSKNNTDTTIEKTELNDWRVKVHVFLFLKAIISHSLVVKHSMERDHGMEWCVIR